MNKGILLGMGPRPTASRTVFLVALSTFSLLIYALYVSPFSLSNSLRYLSDVLAPAPRIRATCPPRAYANGSWTPKSPYTVPNHGDMVMHAPEDALAFAGFEGCASNREYFWHLAADKEEQWDRWPGVTSWQWTPAEDCEVRPFSSAALVKDMVENGGWLLIGDSVTENHFFSLSCLLYPHVLATPDYSLGVFDRAWPQHLYLSPTSPLIPHLALPPGFAVGEGGTPLVTFRRVDLLMDQAELEALYAEDQGSLEWQESSPASGSSSENPGAAEAGRKPLFSDEQFWSLSPREYVRALFLQPLPHANYGTLVVSTGGHWTTTLLAGLADADAPGGGIRAVLDFFERAMGTWAREVQGMLEEYRAAHVGGTAARARPKQVVVRAYLPGHEDCHDEREPWTEWRPFVWGWYNWASIGEFNSRFESVLNTTTRYPDIHFLPIDRPALLRPDAHAAGDCLHIMTGAGVLEGWTHYIWHYVTRELPGRIR